jgi:hypothetical protein
MTNHAELSRDLALALGWKKVQLHRGKYDYPKELSCMVCADPPEWNWRWFDYRSPDVALPLLKWLIRNRPEVILSDLGIGRTVYLEAWSRDCELYTDGDTLEEAIARAVIAVRVE